METEFNNFTPVMKKCVVFIFLALAIVSCSKDPTLSINTKIIGVFYTGHFERNGMTSYVELEFSSNMVTGNSDHQYFPAICAATYEIHGSTITFENTCIWPAHFDWSLILNGTWHFSMGNEQLTLTHPNGDVYILNKLP
ncbi:MAG: hypothetical protein ACI9JN_002605 [Bacteroidia bacterium]